MHRLPATHAHDPSGAAPDYVRSIAPYVPGKPVSELAREFGLAEADHRQARVEREPARARVPRCARRSPPRSTSCRATRTATASRSRRRWPRATASAPRASCSATAPTTSSSSSRRRSCGPATRPSTRGTRSPSIRWPRRRAARTASRCRRTISATTWRRCAGRSPRRTRIVFVANPNNPTGTWIAPDGARGVHRFGAAGRRWSCSTRPTTSTSSRRSRAVAAVGRPLPEPRRLAHVLQGATGSRRCASATD